MFCGQHKQYGAIFCMHQGRGYEGTDPIVMLKNCPMKQGDTIIKFKKQ